MASTGRMTTTGFFKPGMNASLAEARTESPVVYVGQDGDSVFRAVAVGILDNVLNERSGNRALIAQIMSRYNAYFPPSATRELLTPDERLQRLIQAPQGLARLIRDWSWILRQMAVDEMLAHPWHYRSAFEQAGSVAVMRRMDFPLGESGLAALAQAVSLPLLLRFTNRANSLPLLHRYGPWQAAGDALSLGLRGQNVSVCVRNPARFQVACEQHLPPCQPMALHRPDPDWNVLWRGIQLENERVIRVFQQQLRRLNTMVAANELDKDDLLSAYIQSLGQTASIGVVCGDQAVLDELLPATFAMVMDHIRTAHDDDVVHHLTHALACAAALGHLDDELLFGNDAINDTHQARLS